MTIFDIITAVGIPSIIIGLVFIGKKLQILDDLNLTVEKIKNNVKVVGDFLTRNSTNFNNPSRNLENTAPTLGVYIRDKYLVEHPEITE